MGYQQGVYMFDLLLIFVIVFLLNVNPLLTLPTWLVVSFFVTTGTVPLVEALVLGIAASTTGRYLLAVYSGALSMRYLPEKQKKNIKFLKNFLKGEGSPLQFVISTFYALSPLPTNALFIIAGAARANLLVIAAGFFTGEFLSGLIYLGVLTSSITMITTLQYLLVGLVGIAIALVVLFIDWEHVIKRLIEHEKARRVEFGLRETFREK